MLAADGPYLLQMMTSVGPMEVPPLSDTERSKDGVADHTARTENGLSLVQPLIHVTDLQRGIICKHIAANPILDR